MVMDNTWLNSDGLYVKFGKTEGVSRTQGGFVCDYGPFHDIWLNLELTQLTEAEEIQNDVIVIPANSLILQVETITVTAAATGAAIDVGLIANTRITTTDLNGSVTDADPDGLLAAHPITAMSEVGEYNSFWTQTEIPASVVGSGALIGNTMTVPTMITASRTTSTAFTAGRVLLHVRTIPMATTGFTQTHVG